MYERAESVRRELITVLRKKLEGWYLTDGASCEKAAGDIECDHEIPEQAKAFQKRRKSRTGKSDRKPDMDEILDRKSGQKDIQKRSKLRMLNGSVMIDLLR